ncbi:hypothetical protein [Paenisporosarcina sp.]|uniref:hypothetical protein n=1 Tax=Paenisporosarcina sp. TaxID=1932001 RepID=UPI003C77F9D6
MGYHSHLANPLEGNLLLLRPIGVTAPVGLFIVLNTWYHYTKVDYVYQSKG